MSFVSEVSNFVNSISYKLCSSVFQLLGKNFSLNNAMHLLTDSARQGFGKLY